MATIRTQGNITCKRCRYAINNNSNVIMVSMATVFNFFNLKLPARNSNKAFYHPECYKEQVKDEINGQTEE